MADLSTRWDVYRDAAGNPVTVECDYGHFEGELTDEQLVAVRHAFAVWEEVCTDNGYGRAWNGAYRNEDGKVIWTHPNIAKSRLLGRMIHQGKPPHDLPPPLEHSGGWWEVIEDGHALLPDTFVSNRPYDGKMVICQCDRWNLHTQVGEALFLLTLPRREEIWELRHATTEEIGESNKHWAPYWWLSRIDG